MRSPGPHKFSEFVEHVMNLLAAGEFDVRSHLADHSTGRHEATRRYPWAPEQPSPTTCYLSDAEWSVDDLRHGQTLDELPLGKADFRTRPDGQVLDRLDLMIDFIPVLHVSNTVADGEHFGQSMLAKVMQALDELAETDTDSARASATTGAPIIGLAGARAEVDRVTGRPKPLAVQPGTIFQLADGGRMDGCTGYLQPVGGAAGSGGGDPGPCRGKRPAAGGQPRDSRSERRAQWLCPPDQPGPAGFNGRLDAAGPRPQVRAAVEDGAALHQAGRAKGWPIGPTLPARLVFGPHMPTDRQAILDEVVKGVGAGVFSLETGIRMLQDAGYPIEDAREEVARITARAAAASPGLAAKDPSSSAS